MLTKKNQGTKPLFSFLLIRVQKVKVTKQIFLLRNVSVSSLFLFTDKKIPGQKLYVLSITNRRFKKQKAANKQDSEKFAKGYFAKQNEITTMKR